MPDFHRQVPRGYFEALCFLAHHDRSVAKCHVRDGSSSCNARMNYLSQVQRGIDLIDLMRAFADESTRVQSAIGRVAHRLLDTSANGIGRRDGRAHDVRSDRHRHVADEWEFKRLLSNDVERACITCP